MLDEARLRAALFEQKKWGGKLGRTLVEMGFIEEPEMMRVLAKQLHLQTVDLDTAPIPERIVENLRLDLAERYGVFPIAMDLRTKVLHVATADPSNVDALQELEFVTNLKVEPVVATGSSIERAIRRYYFGEVTNPSHAASPPAATETIFELDQLLGERSAPPPTAAPNLEELKAALAQSKQQVAQLEQIAAGQVKALRTLLELLIESGLIGREEYLARLKQNEGR